LQQIIKSWHAQQRDDAENSRRHLLRVARCCVKYRCAVFLASASMALGISASGRSNAQHRALSGRGIKKSDGGTHSFALAAQAASSNDINISKRSTLYQRCAARASRLLVARMAMDGTRIVGVAHDCAISIGRNAIVNSALVFYNKRMRIRRFMAPLFRNMFASTPAWRLLLLRRCAPWLPHAHQ